MPASIRPARRGCIATLKGARAPSAGVPHPWLAVLIPLVLLTGCGRKPREYPGRALFLGAFCVQCHGENRQGTKQGPPLKQLTRYWTAESLLGYLADPAATVETNPRLKDLSYLYPALMPKFNMSDTDRRELVRFLLEVYE